MLISDDIQSHRHLIHYLPHILSTLVCHPLDQLYTHLVPLLPIIWTSVNDMEMKYNIVIRDCRPNLPNGAKKSYRFGQISDDWADIYAFFTEKFGNKDFVLCVNNEDNTTINEFNYSEVVTSGMELIIKGANAAAPGIINHEVNIAPHYHTITQSGMYEYYSSRGIDSVVIAMAELIDNSLSAVKDNKGLRLIDLHSRESMAELIDNSLSAVKDNKGLRLIEIRHYDNGSDSMVVIIDNGCGMSLHDLTNWAKFKFSKFVRQSESTDAEPMNTSLDSGVFSSADLPLSQHQSPYKGLPADKQKPRFLDSDINFFGAGGKQAIFNIGKATTMISKIASSDSICELTLSVARFDEKSKFNPDAVFKEQLSERPKGLTRPLPEEPRTSDYIEDAIIKEIENEFKSFTICCIKDVFSDHSKQFKKNKEHNNFWMKGLARIYHYYLHGPKGNTGAKESVPDDWKRIDIMIKGFSVNKTGDTVQTHLMHNTQLKSIDDDFESQLVRSAKDTFEFEVEHYDKKDAIIEGIIRYHPYQHDRETLPVLDINDDLGGTASIVTSDLCDEDGIDSYGQKPRGKWREVFECFWHGRLIPQDGIDFEWNKFNPKSSHVDKDMEESYYRLSGALFTNSHYQVSQNKQSFMDLSQLMSKKDCLTFFKVDSNGRRVRGTFENLFMSWLKNCHLKYDKQVQYLDYQYDIPRNEVSTLRKSTTGATFSVFHRIVWKDKEWKKGDQILTRKTKPANIVGVITKFLVPVKCSGDYIGSPGYVEIYQIPDLIYGKDSDASKIISFTKINTDATPEEISTEYNKLFHRLPHKMQIGFPNAFSLHPGDAIVAGRPIGDIQIKLINANGEDLTTDRIPQKATTKKLQIQADILRIEGRETSVELSYPEFAEYNKNWHYWFTQSDGLQKTGKFRLVFACVSDAKKETVHGKFANGDSYPKDESIEFTVIAGPPIDFKVNETTVKTMIGKPFDLSLTLYDKCDNVVTPHINAHIPILSIRGFVVKFEKLVVADDELVIKNIVISGKLTQNQKKPILDISLPSFELPVQIEIDLQFGNPSEICLLSDGNIAVINGTTLELGVVLKDSGGNDVTFVKHCVVYAKVFEKKESTKTAVTSEFTLIPKPDEEPNCLAINHKIEIKAGTVDFSLRQFVLRFYLKSNPNVFLEKDIVFKKNSKPTFIRLYF
ncbi:unnamed protein product, partial [Medioppia subpectinata]